MLNKIDLEKKFNEKIDNAIEISTKTKQGKEKLIEALKNHIKDSDITIFNKESYVNNRERGYLERAIEQLNICIEKSNNNHLLDEVAEEINILNNILGNVSGKIEAEEIINEIFENFCIGK